MSEKKVIIYIYEDGEVQIPEPIGIGKALEFTEKLRHYLLNTPIYSPPQQVSQDEQVVLENDTKA